jgi:hypothetical protein
MRLAGNNGNMHHCLAGVNVVPWQHRLIPVCYTSTNASGDSETGVNVSSEMRPGIQHSSCAGITSYK